MFNSKIDKNLTNNVFYFRKHRHFDRVQNKPHHVDLWDTLADTIEIDSIKFAYSF